MKQVLTILILFCFHLSSSYGQSVNKVPAPAISPTVHLAVLAKVWGYLKYYHPTVLSGKYNWDDELVKILPIIQTCKSIKSRDSILLKWVSKLGAVNVSEKSGIDTSRTQLLPDYSWIKQPALTGELVSWLADIRHIQPPSEQYYVEFDSIPIPLFKNELSYANTPYPDTCYRLLSLFRFWNIIQYFYPYRDLSDWDHILTEYIPRFMNASNEKEYLLNVLSLVAHLHDGHANITSTHEVLESYKGTRCAPYEIRFIENKAVVTDYLDEFIPGNKRPENRSVLKKGDVIIKINNLPVADIIRKRLPYVSGSTYAAQLREIAIDLLRTNNPVVTVSVYRNNSIQQLRLRSYPIAQVDLNKRFHPTDTCFSMITEHIAYINPITLRSEYIPGIMDRIQHTKGLIIDFRLPPQENMTGIGDYLSDIPRSFAILSRARPDCPGLFTIWDTISIGKKNDISYRGKVILLTNEDTQSAAEFSTMAFRSIPGVRIIGSTTAGTDGDVTSFCLPGGINISITGLGVYYPDGGKTQQTGIKPDIECKPTISGIIKDKDELLEKAINLILN
ncbi:MAG TPA: S41 family peptidase [Chitinophaga sp.]|uniref:S41 family peptidase n=1 Tax=Chitinophaga sp. TaxID=1869181 RepID=UPI002C1BC814|nr:S41 family peptidase [Chitinophaga sp.]HVI43859.1 S41 family peptidase [Chitinophaga sp.]